MNRRTRLVLGFAMLIVGMATNPWVVERWLIPDGRIESVLIILFFSLAALGFAAAGVFLLSGAPAPSMPGGWLASGLLLLASVAASVGVAEIALRLVPSFRSAWPPPRVFAGERENRRSRNFVPDSLLGWRMRSAHESRATIEGRSTTYVSNDTGFRVGVIPEDVDAHRRTVSLVGDSFAFGLGVNYHETFGAGLAERVGDTRVTNLAMPGFGVDQMWMTVQHVALELKPDLIIVAFIDNDFDRSLTAFRSYEGFVKPTFVLGLGGPRRQTPHDRPGFPFRWLEANSALWGGGRIIGRSLGYSLPVGSWLKLNTALLRRIHEECLKRAIPVTFVRLPTRGGRPFPQLARTMQEMNARYLDLGDPGSMPAGIHFESDMHLNVVGHRYVARAIAEWFEAGVF